MTNTNDAGAGSFRQAIANANTNLGADNIFFNIAGTGIHTISLVSGLPVISDAVNIDATTDDSFAANGNRPAVVLNGGGTIQDGLLLYTGSAGSTVRGLIIQNFIDDGIDISDSDSNTIAGNWLGLNAAGTGAAGNSVGVNIWQSSNNIIGGITLADRNIISGNTQGVYIGSDTGKSSYNNVVLGNYIGTNVTGTTAIANSVGVIVVSTNSGLVRDNVIGGNASLNAGNLVSGNRTRQSYRGPRRWQC